MACKDSAVLAFSSTPSWITALVFVTISTALLAAWALLPASSFTSSATIANPRPALPARAASTDAFSARILVWNAILSMAMAILVISWALELILFIALERASICIFASCTFLVISPVIVCVWSLLLITPTSCSLTWVTSSTSTSVA